MAGGWPRVVLPLLTLLLQVPLLATGCQLPADKHALVQLAVFRCSAVAAALRSTHSFVQMCLCMCVCVFGFNLKLMMSYFHIAANALKYLLNTFYNLFCSPSLRVAGFCGVWLLMLLLCG